jgi:SAM-dependent methyltransferase
MLKRILNVVERHGMAGTVRVALHALYDLARENSPARRRGRRRQLDFDRRYGVDTVSKVAASELGASGDSARHAQGYQATSVEAFLAILGSIAVQHERFTFVDIGCGKGRTLLLASHFPFRHIIGVEFSPQLVATAQRNVGVYRDPQQKCRSLEVVCADAAQYRLPEGDLLLYMYNPFDAPVMERFLENVRRAGMGRDAEIRIAYVNPVLKPMLDGSPFLRAVPNTGGVALYRVESAAARDVCA